MKLPENCWILHHDNDPVHSVLLVLQFVVEKQGHVHDYNHYSPDIVPNNYSLFTLLKYPSKGMHFQSIEVLKKEK
jgi:hypothetical protein